MYVFLTETSEKATFCVTDTGGLIELLQYKRKMRVNRIS